MLVYHVVAVFGAALTLKIGLMFGNSGSPSIRASSTCYGTYQAYLKTARLIFRCAPFLVREGLERPGRVRERLHTWAVQLDIPQGLLAALEERVRYVIREELEHAVSNSRSPWMDVRGAAKLRSDDARGDPLGNETWAAASSPRGDPPSPSSRRRCRRAPAG